MRSDTREAFVGRTQADLTSGNACLETPPAIFEKLNREFKFDLDLTADAQRALCPQWFGPGSALRPDTLTAPWARWGSTGFSNPPYGPFVKQLLAKAKYQRWEGFTSVLLLPLRVTKAFADFVMEGASEVRLCDRRITFWENGAPRLNKKVGSANFGKPDPALFDSMVVVYRPGKFERAPLFSMWEVPDHTPKGVRGRSSDEKTRTVEEALAAESVYPV